MWHTDLRIELRVRARTILLLAAGMPVSAVARQVGCGRRIVRKWGVRFQKKRLRGLLDLHARRATGPLFPPEVAAHLVKLGIRCTIPVSPARADGRMIAA